MTIKNQILLGKVVSGVCLLTAALSLVYTSVGLLKQAEAGHDAYLFMKAFSLLWLAKWLLEYLPKFDDK